MIERLGATVLSSPQDTGGGPRGRMRDAPARTALGWFVRLKRSYPQWYAASRRPEVNPRPWPLEFNPQRDPVFARNELLIPAAPERIFELLIRATEWPAFYPNSADVRIAAGDHLTAGARFRWRTFSTRQESEVTLFEPDRALGWTAESAGTHAYHRWLLAREESGTRVITEECQNGPVAWLDRFWMNPSLHAAHQLWLEKLKEQSLA